MKILAEYLIVAVVAVMMAWVGYGGIDARGGFQSVGDRFLDLQDVGWVVWASLISILTWSYLYHHCRHLHWLVLPVMGLISPVIGALLFFVPFFVWPFVVIWEYAVVVFPVGLMTGLIISVSTLPLRPRQVLRGNV